MKKVYVTPETNVYQMDVEQPLLVGSVMSFSDESEYEEDAAQTTSKTSNWWFD